MTRQVKQIVWLIIFGVLSLSCSLLNSFGSQVEGAKATVQSVATSVQEGQKWIQTAQAVATEVGNSGLLETAQIVATQFGDSAFMQTAQAFVTQEAPGLLETGQALVTEQGPHVIETAKALASQIPSSSGVAPSDIPIIQGEREDLFTSQEMVSYTTTIEYAQVLEFYKTEMPANGWIKRDKGTVETGNVSILYYEKSGQTATITISKNPANGKTVVLINIRRQ
jgi:hypothetical protein